MIVRKVTKRMIRFYRHSTTNQVIRKMAEAIQRTAPPSSGQPVVIFNASTRLEALSLNAGFSLLTSWALRMAGVPVHHFVCEHGMSRCVLGTDRDDPTQLPPCKRCIAQSKVITAHADATGFAYVEDSKWATELSQLSIADLIEVERDGLPLGQLVLPALRWVLRRHHLVDDAGTRFLFCQFLLSAYSIARQFGALLDEIHPRAVVVFNGQFFPEATARFVAQQRGLPVISHEVGLRPYSAFFTPGEATAYPIDIPPSFQLTPEQDARLDAYLEDRFQGNFSMAGIRFWKGMEGLTKAFWERAESYQQIVPIFTNVIFDTSQGHANVLFPHMFAWLDEVLDIIRNHPETLFVIRAHPDEKRPGKESRESVAQWVAERSVHQLPNVMFVDSDETISSYDLIQHAKFVMIYNSTIGLEAALMGAAVLCAGKARFTQLPTVFFPPAPVTNFRRMAEEFLSAKMVEVPTEFRQNARRFMYTQLFRTSLPFDAFLEEDGVWQGYVKLRRFTPRQLSESQMMQIVTRGILDGTPFIVDELP